MKLSKAAWGYGLIVVIYLGMLFYADAQKGFFEFLPTALAQLPVLMSLALLSFGLRYARWFYLLRLAGSHVPFGRGWLAYLSGFAFTATPGKVGELVRIRYFGRLQVDASRVMSAFVFERALDLVVVLGLALFWVADHQMLGLAAGFVCVVLLVVCLVVLRPAWIGALAAGLAVRGWPRLARLLHFMAEAFVGCRVWVKPWPLVICVLLGIGAWSVTAYAFVHLLDSLRLDVPWLAAFSAYPLAMLAGAASMLPGGVGSTEAAIVVQLQWHGVPVAMALLAAVVVRLGTMWFSVLCGLVAILVLEMQWPIPVCGAKRCTR
jgi:uncharacterized membrane protein YbhN (UPF0104 family)